MYWICTEVYCILLANKKISVVLCKCISVCRPIFFSSPVFCNYFFLALIFSMVNSPPPVSVYRANFFPRIPMCRKNLITIILLTFRQHLRALRLFGGKAHSDLLDTAVFLQDQLDEYGMLYENKIMHLKRVHAGYVVTQETTRRLLLGVELRSRSMPYNFVSTVFFAEFRKSNSYFKKQIC